MTIHVPFAIFQELGYATKVATLYALNRGNQTRAPLSKLKLVLPCRWISGPGVAAPAAARPRRDRAVRRVDP
eukprot:4150098-Prymnesium_polylepis.1